MGYAPGMLTRFAFDRSMRSTDVDGRLHVEAAPISKANVCPYFGREIPGADALGLNPNQIYQLYRDPAELAAAAPSFENLPLLIKHVIHGAEKPLQDLTVGVVSGVEFKHPYLMARLAVWTAEAIALVESGTQEQLSSAYRYTADMTPGATPDGLRYDGVMRNIIGNHVALVEVGRAGPDVVVADEKPPELRKMKFPRIFAALSAVLATVAKPADFVALDAALDAELADDALPELSEDEKSAACDAALKASGKESLSDEEKADAYKRAAKDKKAKDGAPAKAVGGAPVPSAFDEGSTEFIAARDAAVAAAIAALPPSVALDSAEFQTAVDAEVTKRTQAAQALADALATARAAVEPLVGVVALDSAAEVYRFALEKQGIALDGIPDSALAAMVALAARKPATPVVAAIDSSPAERLPAAALRFKVM